MKLTLMFVLAGIIQVIAVNSYSQTTKLNLELRNVSVAEVLKAIENQSEFYFVYNKDAINLDRKIDLNAKNLRVEEILDYVFKATNVNYKITDRHIILSTLEATQEKKSVSGKVIDSSGLPLPGVSVVIKGTTTGALTDSEGHYSLSNIPENATLQFSFVGMKKQEVVPGTKTSLNVRMEEETVGIEEVVAIGYGVQKKSDVTGSVASITSKQLEQTSQTNIAQALQGRISGMGVSITSSSAEDGDTKIRIRGVNSISASSDPLIILDGIPYNFPLSEINPTDIQSLEVLKDASSSAIYGARAANGVILITTKKGISSASVVKFETNFTTDQIARRPRYLTGEEYYKAINEREGMSSQITPEEEANYAEGISTDWQKLATRNGLRQQNNLSISGGTDKINYYLSGGLSDTKGITQGDDYVRTSFRINLEGKVTSWLSVGTNAQFASINRSGVPVEYYYESIQAAPSPLLKPYKEDGTLNVFPEPSNGTNSATRNILDPILYDNLDITRSLVTNNYLDFKFPWIKGLSYRLSSGYTFRSGTTELYKPSTSGSGYSSGGIASISNGNNEDWIIDNIINYNQTFKKHAIMFTALYSAQKNTKISHSSTGIGFPNDIQSTYQMRNATVITGTDSYVEMGYISQMARLNYNYDGRYLLTTTVRRDGFSGFGSNNKIGVFPSVALGWNITEENFVSSLGWLGRAKLRLSYGENGNQAIGPYSTVPALATNWYLDGSGKAVVGYYPNAIGDPTLSWELTRSFNVGLDFGFFKNRLSGSFDMFFSKTSDLLLNRKISPVNGTSSIKQNVGSTQNFGYEVLISSVNISSPNFTWNTDFNLSFSKNKIEDVGLYDENGKPISDVGNRWFIGKSLGIIYSYVFDHIMQEGETPPVSQPTAKPGYALVVDKLKDDKIDANDMEILGYNTPFFYTGMTNTLNYKNVSLTFLFTGQFGKKGGAISSYWPGSNTLYREWWTSEKPNIEYPSNSSLSNPYGVAIYNKKNNCDFVRLQDVTLTYKFINKAWMNKIGLKQTDIYGGAKNVFTITDWAWGPDPEFSDQSGIPSIKSIICGLRVTF